MFSSQDDRAGCRKEACLSFPVKRLRAGMGEGSWNGLVQTVGAMIDVFDCAVNVTENTAAGCYIDRVTSEKLPKDAEGGISSFSAVVIK